jgi:AraC-like DNA-binding protein
MLKDLIIYTPMYVTFFWSAVLLLTTTANNRAKKFLAFFMIAAFLVYLSHALYFKQYLHGYLIFDSFYTLASLSVYPLYYWYIKLLTIETSYDLNNLKFLAPAAVMSILCGGVYILMQPEERMDYLHSFLLNKEVEMNTSTLVQIQKTVYYISRLIFATQVIYFVFRGRKLVIRYNKRVANFYSNLESRTTVWVNLLLYSFVATSVMSIVFNILGRQIFLQSLILLLIPSLIFSVLLFLIGLLGYMQNHTVEDIEKDEMQQPEKNLKNYNHTQLKEQILHLFATEKIYLNSDLKITQVSAKLKTNRTYVSNLINNEFACSFSDFVNRYRIEEAKQMLENNGLTNYSLNYISEAVGFGSLNTFIRVFKETEGITPGNFRIQNQLAPSKNGATQK